MSHRTLDFDRDYHLPSSKTVIFFFLLTDMRVSISPQPADWLIRFLNLCKSERGRAKTACLNLPLPVRKVQHVLVLGSFCFFFFESLFVSLCLDFSLCHLGLMYKTLICVIIYFNDVCWLSFVAV